MKFTNSHEWITCQENIGSVGITTYAQKELGEIVYVELPKVGQFVKKGHELAVLESTKAAADIYAPISGEIVEVNQVLSSDCTNLNNFPESLGWICKIRLVDAQELDELLSHDDYLNLIGTGN